MRILMFLIIMGTMSALQAQSNKELFSSTKNQIDLTDAQTKLIQRLSGEKELDVHQFVTINPEVLFNDAIVLPLYGNAITFNLQRKKTIDEIDYWQGMEKNTNEILTLSNSDGEIRGDFSYNGIPYLIYPLDSKGNYSIIDISATYNEEHICQVSKEHIVTDQSGTSSMENFAGVNDCKVRMLIAYTDDVEAIAPNLKNDIKAAVNDINLYFDNSEIGHRVELAYIREFIYDESHNNMNTALDDIRTSSILATSRDKYDADVVMLITTFGSGLAYVNSGEDLAFGVSSYSNMVNSRTLAHELGHTYGAQHDVLNDNDLDNPYEYNHGYNAVDEGNGDWHTIMSYQNGCSCPRIAFFSNPDISFGSVPLGTNETHDNTRVINDRAETVSTFRVTPNNKTLSAETILGDQKYAYVYAGNKITTNGNYRILSGAEVRFKAPNGMKLDKGFKVGIGSTFKTILGSCGSAINSFSVPNEENSSPLASVDEKQEIETEEDNFKLAENQLVVSPNPIEATATVRWNLKEASNTNIFISNLTGKKVMILSNGQFLEKGNHQFEMNVEHLPSGIYLCTLQTNEGTQTIKLNVSR